MTSLVKLYDKKHAKIITSIEASLATVWNREEFPVINLKAGMTIDRDTLLFSLQDQGYYTVPVVSKEGDMSIRGGIIDIFPPDSELPARIELFGDEIESLRYFDIDTQLSVRETESLRICPAEKPESNTTVLEVLTESLLILNEPDDIRKHYPETDMMPESRKHVNFTSLPLEADYRLAVNAVSGLGLLREERKTLEDFIQRVNVLRSEYFILMVCSSQGQARRLKELFFEHETGVPVLSGNASTEYTHSPVITVGELSSGFAYGKTVILSERDIFGQRPVFKSTKKSRVSNLISSVEDFREGDYLVHEEHGIGRYLGIKKEIIEGCQTDLITIEYLGGDKLSVPLDRINTVQKYHAPDGVKPKIDRLGGKTWQKTKQAVKKKIKDLAEKLLKIYARRTAAEGHAFSEDAELHREFDGFFPYEETPDQFSSINEIKRSMENPAPMDRLLCGDVGYGKTEVIMRACFKAVYDSKQVAVLVPTTILAEQHYETFISRFSAFPVRIDYLSRFKSKAEQKKTLKSLAEGSVDIIIGTHGLLGKNVKYYDLGLLIIDEEHKFGVSHKEKIKSITSGVDVLSLSATPIPRTLHMALSGIREMSTIETPPEERMAVKTIVARFNPQIITEALKHEIERGGQAFFVHNRIQDIYKIGNSLKEMVPEAKIGVAHGQMREKELENVMRAFSHREMDILVATSIIGSGLDIPSANTIVINRADRFGLADLYQLKGRVGRSDVRAYAYFLIPGEDIITEDARKKLQAIQEMSYLGAGFRLALKDLEIRGAGNLLGAEQSGHIAAVGFDMYMEMLESAVSELKGEKPVQATETVVDLRIPAMIPEDYIEDPDIRLSIYRKIASAKSTETVDRLFEELRDRFGKPPEETRHLLEAMELKISAMALAITKIENVSGRVRIIFSHDTHIGHEKIFNLHKTRKGHLKFLPEGGVELDLRKKIWPEIYEEIKSVIKELESNAA